MREFILWAALLLCLVFIGMALFIENRKIDLAAIACLLLYCFVRMFP